MSLAPCTLKGELLGSLGLSSIRVMLRVRMRQWVKSLLNKDRREGREDLGEIYRTKVHNFTSFLSSHTIFFQSWFHTFRSNYWVESRTFRTGVYNFRITGTNHPICYNEYTRTRGDGRNRRYKHTCTCTHTYTRTRVRLLTHVCLLKVWSVRLDRTPNPVRHPTGSFCYGSGRRYKSVDNNEFSH